MLRATVRTRYRLSHSRKRLHLGKVNYLVKRPNQEALVLKVTLLLLAPLAPLALLVLLVLPALLVLLVRLASQVHPVHPVHPMCLEPQTPLRHPNHQRLLSPL